MTEAVTYKSDIAGGGIAGSDIAGDFYEDRTELLNAFTDSVFGEIGLNSPPAINPRAYMARKVFALRLNREYKHFINEGLSPGRAAAAAIGRADNFLPGNLSGKNSPKIYKAENTREQIADCNIKVNPKNAAERKSEGDLPRNLQEAMPRAISKEHFSEKNEKREVENNMKNSLKVYVDSLFRGAPESEPVRELHDEILSNLEERYDDCIAGGMTPQRAYTAVVGTMGDIGKLIRQVSEENKHPGGLFERSSPTGKGIFKKYSYIFTDKNLKIIKRSAIAVMWILLVAFYFMISFNTRAWDATWIVFLAGAGLNIVINMAGDIARFSRSGDNGESRVKILKSIQLSMSGILWLAATFLFFMIGMSHRHLFERAWIVFVFAAAVQVVLNAVMKIQISRYSE